MLFRSLPTLVTNSGGMTEYINENTTLIVEREDIVTNLKKEIMHLKEYPEVRRQMAENAKVQSKKYDETIYYRNFVEMIAEIKGE